MRKIILALAAACLIGAAPTSAQQQPHFSADRIKADVAFLADDLLEGRGNGTRGYELAARFVAARFEALGLTPGNNGGWYQRVPFVEASLKPGSAVNVRIGDTSFVNGKDVAITATPFFPDQKVTADTIFVGHGLDAPAQGFDDYAGLDVRGKFVVALFGFPPGTPSEIGAHLNLEKARMAQDRGAVGLLTIQTPTADKVASWATRVKGVGRSVHSWLGTGGKPYSIAPDLQVNGWLGEKPTAMLFAGAPTPYPQILEQTARPGGRAKGFPLAQKITVERHSATAQVTGPNVMGILRGSDPRLADEYILLTGHLDAIGIVEPENGDAIVNGAMDNASGIATMLEAARAFAESGQRPKRSIMFVALSGEEKGLLGASYLANNPVLGRGKIVGLVNLDMPILTYDFRDVIAFGSERSTIGSAVARAIAGDGLTLSPDPEPEQNLFVRTDHYMFVRKGVPAVSLKTGHANDGEVASTGFRDKRYHQAGDDMSQAFNWAAAAKFARVNYLIANELANAPEAPRWYDGDFFGDTFAKGEPKARR